MRAALTSIRILILTALICAAILAAESSGGAGSGTNTVSAARPIPATGLPWPEPDRKTVEKLKTELRGELSSDFQILTVGPWIIATDLDAATAKDYASSTITKYAGNIQRQLFTSKPRSEPVKVLLFKDRTSYLAWNQKLYGEQPSTPYGYYSRTRNALVMNIGTGGGTLLHEMVHAMAEVDFPAIPAWLNEGLGSLFEASMANSAGRVFGVTNWRLKGLQQDLARNTAVHYKDLLAASDETFYGERSGSNYASARYLMQWLQSHGKLEAFYTRIRDKKDADALTSLRAVFDDKFTVDEIETKVYDWAKTLNFGR